MITYPGFEVLDFSKFLKEEEVMKVEEVMQVVEVMAPPPPPAAVEVEERQRKQSKWEQIMDTVKNATDKLPGTWRRHRWFGC